MKQPTLKGGAYVEIGLAKAQFDALVRNDRKFYQIWQELQLVSGALDHWSRTKGPASAESLLYRELRRDRIEEIERHVRGLGFQMTNSPPHKGNKGKE